MKATLLLTLLMSTTLLAKEVSLLGGHLTIDLPDETKPGMHVTNHIRAIGAMPVTGATLCWVGNRANSISILSHERLEFAGPDFIGETKERLKKGYPSDFEIHTAGDNIVYALATQAAKKPTGADCYGVAYVRSKDGMVQSVAFHFAPKAAKDIKAAREFITKAVSSIKDGAWSPDLLAHTTTFGTQWGMDISIPVPEGYFLAHDSGEDFDVYGFHEVRRPGSGGSGFGVYIGPHPGHTEKMDACTNRKDGKMLGKAIKWCIFPAESDDKYNSAEIVLPLGDAESAPCMHVFLRADTMEKLDKLISAAEGMSITRKDTAKTSNSDL